MFRRDAADETLVPLQCVVDLGEYLRRFQLGWLLGVSHSSGEVNQRRVGVANFHVLVVTAFQLDESFLHQRNPELARLVAVASKDQLVDSVILLRRQPVIDRYLAPYSEVPKSKPKLTRVVTLEALVGWQDSSEKRAIT